MHNAQCTIIGFKRDSKMGSRGTLPPCGGRGGRALLAGYGAEPRRLRRHSQFNTNKALRPNSKGHQRLIIYPKLRGQSFAAPSTPSGARRHRNSRVQSTRANSVRLRSKRRFWVSRSGLCVGRKIGARPVSGAFRSPPNPFGWTSPLTVRSRL